MQQSQEIVLRERVYIFLTYLFLLYSLSFLVTQTWLPKSGGEGLWFVSAVGFVSFNLLSAPFFVKPKDALARALAVFLLLSSLDLSPVLLFRQRRVSRTLRHRPFEFSVASALSPGRPTG